MYHSEGMFGGLLPDLRKIGPNRGMSGGGDVLALALAVFKREFSR
jgi:hypothetical protein